MRKENDQWEMLPLKQADSLNFVLKTKLADWILEVRLGSVLFGEGRYFFSARQARKLTYYPTEWVL